jgi:hypothetical protein
MLSGSTVFRWCELYVGMLVSHWFLHPVIPTDWFWWSLLCLPSLYRLFVDGHLVGSVHNLSCWFWLLWVQIWKFMESCLVKDSFACYGDLFRWGSLPKCLVSPLLYGRASEIRPARVGLPLGVLWLCCFGS